MKKLKTLEAFEHHVLNEALCVVVFYSDWCPDCHYTDQYSERLESLYNAIPFYLVDRNDLPLLSKDLKIIGVPSFLVFKQGDVCARYVDKERKTFIQVKTFIDQAIHKKGCV